MSSVFNSQYCEILENCHQGKEITEDTIFSFLSRSGNGYYTWEFPEEIEILAIIQVSLRHSNG